MRCIGFGLTAASKFHFIFRILLSLSLSVSWLPSVQDEVLRNEVAQLKSRLSQQERMLTGAVKRLRSTNQLKEGMERLVIEQCKARVRNTEHVQTCVLLL